MASAEAKIAELGLVLPEPPAPAGMYVPCVTTGNLLYLSGAGPRLEDGSYARGKVGAGVTVEQAKEHARLIALLHLGIMRSTLGSLDRVVRVVKVLGMVNAVPDFTEQPRVIDGYSNLLVEVFGDAGRGARSAVGLGSLPFQITVEIEAIVEIRP